MENENMQADFMIINYNARHQKSHYVANLLCNIYDHLKNNNRSLDYERLLLTDGGTNFWDIDDSCITFEGIFPTVTPKHYNFGYNYEYFTKVAREKKCKTLVGTYHRVMADSMKIALSYIGYECYDIEPLHVGRQGIIFTS